MGNQGVKEEMMIEAEVEEGSAESEPWAKEWGHNLLETEKGKERNSHLETPETKLYFRLISEFWPPALKD